MKFKILKEQDLDGMSEAQLDDIDPDSISLDQDVRLEPENDGYKVELRFYDKTKDGTIQPIEQQIASFGADTDMSKESDGEAYSSFTIQKTFATLDELYDFLINRIPIEELGIYFSSNNNFMKVFVFNTSTPNQAVALGPPAITDDNDARALLVLLKQKI